MLKFLISRIADIHFPMWVDSAVTRILERIPERYFDQCD